MSGPGEAGEEDRDRLGPPIERALDAERRRASGQHFTPAEVADLINAFCIRAPEDRVLDPACGTGAILLRARARLRWLGGDGSGLAGVEVDPALAEAARTSLPDARVLTADFLRLDAASGSYGGPFDAVVGNPPYVRQERLRPGAKERAARATQRFLDPVVAGGRIAPAGTTATRLSRRCDLHVHFWPRALAALEPGGRLGLLTSATWLDASYGEPLRRRLLEGFRIVAVLESEVESWFDRARVRTAVTVVEAAAPAAGPVRFVRLSCPLSELAPPRLGAAERLARLDELARDVERGVLRVALGRARETRPESLAGRTWGPCLRLPPFHDALIDRAAERLIPLDEVATVRWGIKTGHDAVFFVPRGAPLPAEPRFFVPAVFSLMEVDRLVLSPAGTRRLLLLVDARREPIAGLHVEGYLRRAERERGSHRRPTCAARERAGAVPRRWFELRPGPPGEILWSIMHQYRHLAPLNPCGLPANDNLLLLGCRPGVDARLLAALLNSHVQAMLKEAHGRRRNEGMLKTQAEDVRAMRVVDPRRLRPAEARAILDAFEALASRAIGSIPEECSRPDRRRLDEAVVRSLGHAPAEAGAVVDRLYDELRALCARERRWEVDAVARCRAAALTAAAPRPARGAAGPGPDCPR